MRLHSVASALCMVAFLEKTLAFQCSPDTILRMATDKRQKQLERECHLAKTGEPECDTRNEVETSWKEFTKLSDQYKQEKVSTAFGSEQKKLIKEQYKAMQCRDKECGCNTVQKGLVRIKDKISFDIYIDYFSIGYHETSNKYGKLKSRRFGYRIIVDKGKALQSRHKAPYKEALDEMHCERDLEGMPVLKGGCAPALPPVGVVGRREGYQLMSKVRPHSQHFDAPKPSQPRRELCKTKGSQDLSQLANEFSLHCERDNICLPDEDLPPGSQRDRFKELHALRAKKYAAYLTQLSLCYGRLG